MSDEPKVVRLTEEDMRDLARSMIRMYGENATDDDLELALPVDEGETVDYDDRVHVWTLYNSAKVSITWDNEDEDDGNPGCSCGFADYGAPGHEGHPDFKEED